MTTIPPLGAPAALNISAGITPSPLLKYMVVPYSFPLRFRPILVLARLCRKIAERAREITTVCAEIRFNGPVFAALDQVARPQLLAGLALLVGLVTATWLRSAAPEWSPDLFTWPMAASLLCAPVVFPWYLLWLLPFLTSASTLLIILWTVSIIPTYVMWHLCTLGRPWGSLPGWVMLPEYGRVAGASAILALRRITRSAASNAQRTSRVKATAPHAILVFRNLCASSNTTFISFH